MELKHVIPNMEKTFGNLEFAGENKVEQRRINGRMTVVSRSFNLYSDVQRADDIVLMAIAVIGVYLGFKREFSKLIGFLVIALIAVGLVFNAAGVKDVLLQLFNKIIGA